MDGPEVPDLRLWYFIMMVVRVIGFVLILDRQFDLTKAPPPLGCYAEEGRIAVLNIMSFKIYDRSRYQFEPQWRDENKSIQYQLQKQTHRSRSGSKKTVSHRAPKTPVISKTWKDSKKLEI